MPKPIAIVGVGLTRTDLGRRDAPYPAITYEAVAAALKDANLEMNDIDAVTYGCMDPFDGVSCPEKWNMDVFGGYYGKPFMKISTGGTTGGSVALSGYYHVASGLYDIVLVVASQRVGESVDAQLVLNTCVDPIYDRWAGIGAITAGALQATAHMAKHRTTEEELAWVAVRHRENAARNPYAHLHAPLTVEDVVHSRIVSWPLKLFDCCPRSTGACAIIMASGERAREITDNPAWIMGAGSVSDIYYWGDKDLAYWDTLALLGRRVFRQARIDSPRRELDVLELYDAFTIQPIMELEALGFCRRGEGGRLYQEGITAFDGELPINPSGGVLCTNPIAASGLIRVAETALQVRGRAGDRQVADAKTGLAHAWGGALQFHTLMVLRGGQ